MTGFINNGGIVTANYEQDGDLKSPWSGTADAGTPVTAQTNPVTGRLEFNSGGTSVVKSGNTAPNNADGSPDGSIYIQF